MSTEHLEQLGLNIAWLAGAITRNHLQAASMAEGRFIFDPHWCDWSRTHYPFPASTNTLVVDDVATSTWRTTQATGDVTYIIGVQRLLDAEEACRLEDELVDVFSEVFAKWAQVNDKPEPPNVEVETPVPGLYVDSVLAPHGPVLDDEDFEATPVALRAVHPPPMTDS